MKQHTLHQGQKIESGKNGNGLLDKLEIIIYNLGKALFKAVK